MVSKSWLGLGSETLSIQRLTMGVTTVFFNLFFPFVLLVLSLGSLSDFLVVSIGILTRDLWMWWIMVIPTSLKGIPYYSQRNLQINRFNRTLYKNTWNSVPWAVKIMGIHEVHIYGHSNNKTATSDEVPIFGVWEEPWMPTDVWFGADKEAEEIKMYQ